MQVYPRRAFAVAVSSVLVVSIAGFGPGGTASAAPAPEPRGFAPTATKLVVTNDTSVSRESPHASPGSKLKLVVRNTPGHRKKVYLKFTVPSSLLADHGRIESAVLKLRAADTSGARVAVRGTKRVSWTQENLNFTKAPRGLAKIANLVRHPGGISSANVTSYVRAAGRYSFQLRTKAGVSKFYSSESRRTPPTLVVTVIRPTSPPPTTPPTNPSAKALLGMSAPDNLWAARVSEVGSGLEARRLFFTGFGANISKAQEACNAGTYPVMSFKTGGPSLGSGCRR